MLVRYKVKDRKYQYPSTFIVLFPALHNSYDHFGYLLYCK